MTWYPGPAAAYATAAKDTLMMDTNHLDVVSINPPRELRNRGSHVPGPLSKIVSRVFASNVLCRTAQGFETEVTLPYFGANPRLFIIWMSRSHVSRDRAQAWKPCRQPIRACSRRRITERSALARILLGADRRQGQDP